jgi:hypothetical protein
MAYITFEIDYNDGNGYVKAQDPLNADDTELELVWSNSTPSATIGSISYEWVGEEAQKLYAYRDKGLNGGEGILEGPGLRIKVGQNVIFEGCIDTANKAGLWECDRVKAPLRENKIDFIKERAASFYFADLRRLGIITTADYKKTPYHVTTIPDGPLTATLILTELVTINQLLKEITDLTNLLTHAGGEAVGTSTIVGAPAAAPALAASIIEIALEVAYIISLIISILVNGQAILEQIIQFKKYKYCMRVEDLFLKACQYMTSTGTPLQFSSSILRQGTYKDITIMPRKVLVPKSGQAVLSLFERDANEVNSTKAYGHFDGSFKQLIEQMSKVFNADIAVKNNTLYFEEKVTGFNVQSGFVLDNKNIEGYTFNYPDPHTTNLSEITATYELDFATDGSDLNTIRQYKGTSIQVTLHPIKIGNPRNVLLTGLNRVALDFALAKRKEYLTPTEKFLDALMNIINGAINAIISVVNAIITAINNIISWFGGNSVTFQTFNYLPTNILANRIGWLDLSDDTFQIQKLFNGVNVGGDWQIHQNNENDVNASTLMTKFHGNNLATRGNQWLIYGELSHGNQAPVKIKFCLDDYVKVLGSNNFTTPSGKNGKFVSLRWKVVNDIASVKYKIKQQYTNNLKETVTIDGNG